MNRLKGRTVLITGASSGIGKAAAQTLAQAGANLILIARRTSLLEEFKEQLPSNVTINIFTVDVTNRKQVKEFTNELQKLHIIPDVLINNAGLAQGLSKLHEGDFGDWDSMIATNITGLLNISRYIIPLMVAKNSGHIVNIGSIAGHQVYPSGNVYNATKFAVRALNEAMNIDLVGTNIRVSSIDPGAVETEFSLVRFKGDKKRAEKVYEGYTPLTPEDIADAIYYVLNAPEHVNIVDMVILPTAQRNPYIIAKNQ